MDALTAVRRAVDPLPAGALRPLLDLLAQDVEFEVASGGDVPGCRKAWGRQAVADYFTALGDLPAFWQLEYNAVGDRVIVWVDESFTVKGSGLEGACELALVMDVRQGRVTRLLVIEDLSCIPGWDFPCATEQPALWGVSERVAGGWAGDDPLSGTQCQPLLSRGGVGVRWRLLTRPSEHVIAVPPA